MNHAKGNFAPGEIEFLLHAYYSPEEHWSLKNGSEAGKEWLHRSLSEGLLVELTAGKYEATDRLKRLIEAWCDTPHPVQRWVMPGDITT